MKVYGLTDIGKKVARDGGGTPEESRVLRALAEEKRMTSDQLDVVGERWVVRSLVNDGLVKVLTNA